MGNAVQAPITFPAAGVAVPGSGRPPPHAAFEPGGQPPPGAERFVPDAFFDPPVGGASGAAGPSPVCPVRVPPAAQPLVPACCRCERWPDEGTRAVELQLPSPVAGAAPVQIAGGVSDVDKTRYYREWDSIRGALTGGDTKLVRGSWVERVHESGGILPRWQDLPPEAAWDSEELLENVRDRNRPTPKILAISHAWLSREHPDPHGHHLQAFAPLLKHYARHHRLGVESLAIFFDWCSLPQRPLAGADLRAHQRAMRNIDVWYAHLLTDVWLLTRLPADAVPYRDRGWTCLEVAASALISAAEFTLDLGRLVPGWRDWDDVMEQCRVGRAPPQLPDAFAAALESKSFAYVEDRKVVADKYWGIFQRGLGCAEQLYYDALAWGDAEVRGLAQVLPRCVFLRTLSLRDNEIGAAGAYALARTLPHIRSLERLDVSGNRLGPSVQQDLRAAWAEAHRPENGLSIGAQQPLAPGSEAGGESAMRAGGAGDSAANSLSAAENSRALTALIARQAAFEARIESAMMRVTEGVAELSNFLGQDNMPGAPNSVAFHTRRGARMTTGSSQPGLGPKTPASALPAGDSVHAAAAMSSGKPRVVVPDPELPVPTRI